MELEIGLNMSYLGENKRALELCSRAETFFYTRPLSSPHRYYQIALDCQRRSLENLGRIDEAFDMLEKYTECYEPSPKHSPNIILNSFPRILQNSNLVQPQAGTSGKQSDVIVCP